MNNEQFTRDCYQQYYRTKSADRNDLLTNPEVLFQTLGFESSIIAAMRASGVDRETAHVLDVGCGNGGSTLIFLRLGFPPKNVCGLDVQSERIVEARARLPGMRFEEADATDLPFEDDSFDLLLESSMFLQITDDNLARRIAREMVRVCKRGGHLVLADWRYGRPGDSRFNPVNRKRIAHLFDVGRATYRIAEFKGALIPPVGRRLSRHLPAAYFLVQALFPILTGQIATLLRKA